MEDVYLTVEEFDLIETNKTGVIAKEGLVIKKVSGDQWYLLTYGKSDEEGNYDINVKQIIIKQ